MPGATSGNQQKISSGLTMPEVMNRFDYFASKQQAQPAEGLSYTGVLNQADPFAQQRGTYQPQLNAMMSAPLQEQQGPLWGEQAQLARSQNPYLAALQAASGRAGTNPYEAEQLSVAREGDPYNLMPAYARMAKAGMMGTGAGRQLAALNANPESVAQLPGYQFQLDQSMDQMKRAAAASGMLGSGSMFGELMKYASGYAASQFNTQRDYLTNLASQQYASKIGALGGGINAEQAGQQIYGGQLANLAQLYQQGTGQQIGALGAAGSQWTQNKAIGAETLGGLTQLYSNNYTNRMNNLMQMTGANVNPAAAAQVAGGIWGQQYNYPLALAAASGGNQVSGTQYTGSSLASGLGGAAGGALLGILTAKDPVLGGGAGAILGGIMGGMR